MSALPPSRYVIRGDALQAREDAATILAAARAEAKTIREAAAQERTAERARGYADGLEAGAAESARLLKSTAAAAEAFLAAREGELTDLAFAIAARVLGALPADAALVSAARTAIAEHRADTALAVRVAPDAAAAMQAVAQPNLRIQVDPALPAGACTLVHPRGNTELGMLDQFRAMMASRP